MVNKLICQVGFYDVFYLLYVALCFLWFAESSQDNTKKRFSIFFLRFSRVIVFHGLDLRAGSGDFKISPIEIGRARWFSNPMGGLDHPHLRLDPQKQGFISFMYILLLQSGNHNYRIPG